MAVEQLTAIGYGLVLFGVLVGVGILVLQKFGDTVVTGCTQASCGAAGAWNATAQVCSNATSANCGAGSGTAYTGISYVATQLGSTGLTSYIPLIIIIMIAGLIFAYFGKGKGY